MPRRLACLPAALFLAALAATSAAPASGQEAPKPVAAAEPSRPRIEALIARMTLEEKAGQLNLVSSHMAQTGPSTKDDVREALLGGRLGGLFNAFGAAYTRSVQEMAVTQTRLGIPLLLGFDVVHGYSTIFPIPLGQAASFDLAEIERAERIASREAAAAGINWIFAPMMDTSRDPRWGRVSEGHGESPWLGALIAAARVRGILGSGLRSTETSAPCIKHFAGNGATEGGRDYSAAPLSERAMRETQLPPFAASIAAGAPCVMAAFNAVDGVPGVANGRLLRDVLRGEWGFKGVVVSDFGAIDELKVHGVAAASADAARMALLAGNDIDMESRSYVTTLPELVRSGLVPEAAVDAAVRRVLTLKDDLGLFDDPFARTDPAREAAVVGRADHKEAALRLAEKSLVLLKNDRETVPFRRDVKRVAVIGPVADSGPDTLGNWSAAGDPDRAVTLAKGIRGLLGESTRVDVLPAGTVEETSPGEIAAAVALAREADLVILALGERSIMSGESSSRAQLGLPGDQMNLARAVFALGKPTAVVLFHGRPLAIEDLDREAPAILSAWFPGSEGGRAIANVLFGVTEPTGRLPMTFPRVVGQIPIHHDQLPTGRPALATYKHYTSTYFDVAPTPLYPFGHGLSTTRFTFGAATTDKPALVSGETLTVRVPVTNVGPRRGTAMVQLYLRPKVAAVSRPVRELRGFARAVLEPGETAVVALPVTEADLAFWQPEGGFAPPGATDIQIMTGPDALSTTTIEVPYRPAPSERAAALNRGG